jgi:hypothetical protein
MTSTQRRRRLIFWRGSFPVLATYTLLIFALALAEQIAPR